MGLYWNVVLTESYTYRYKKLKKASLNKSDDFNSGELWQENIQDIQTTLFIPEGKFNMQESDPRELEPDTPALSQNTPGTGKVQLATFFRFLRSWNDLAVWW